MKFSPFKRVDCCAAVNFFEDKLTTHRSSDVFIDLPLHFFNMFSTFRFNLPLRSLVPYVDLSRTFLHTSSNKSGDQTDFRHSL